MKKLISTVIEESLLATYLYWVYRKNYFFQLQVYSLIKIGVTFGVCIAISKVLDAYICEKWNADKTRNKDREKRIKIIIFRWVLISAVFICGVAVLNMIGGMKTSVGSSLFIGCCAGYCQMLVSHVLDSIVGFNRQQFKDMFTEETFYQDKDCPKGYTLKPFDQWHLVVIEEKELVTELNFEYEKVYYIRGEENEEGNREGFFFNKIDDTHAEILVLNKTDNKDNCKSTVYSIEKAEEVLIVREDSTWGEEVARFKGEEGRYEYNLRYIDDPIDEGPHDLYVHLNDDNDYVFVELLGRERLYVYDAISCYNNSIFSEADEERIKHIERMIMKMSPFSLDGKDDLEYEREILTAVFPMLVQMLEYEGSREEN